jgi:hypothetical protein
VPVEGIEQEPVTESQQLRLNPFPTDVLAAPNPSILVPLIPIPLSPCALVISYVTVAPWPALLFGPASAVCLGCVRAELSSTSWCLTRICVNTCHFWCVDFRYPHHFWCADFGYPIIILVCLSWNFVLYECAFSTFYKYFVTKRSRQCFVFKSISAMKTLLFRCCLVRPFCSWPDYRASRLCLVLTQVQSDTVKSDPSLVNSW